MKEKVLVPGGVWEDDTYYRADRDAYDVYEDDTVFSDDPRYRGAQYLGKPYHIAFFLKGLKNVTLDFCGATVTLHGKLQPFLLDGCENTVIKNVNIRYDRCHFTEGTVASRDEETIALRISPDFPYRVENGELVITGETWENRGLDREPFFMQFFDGETRHGAGLSLVIIGKEPKIDPSLPWGAGTVRFLAEEKDGLLILRKHQHVPVPDAKPGQKVVLAHEGRDISTVQMDCCKNTTLSCFRVLDGCGMGIFPFHCENILLDRVTMTCDERSRGVVTTSADAIHSFGASGRFEIRDSVIEGMVDDGLNVHSNFFTVESVSGDTMTVHTGLEASEYTPLFLPGDRIRVYHGFTLDAAAEYTIRAVRPVGHQLAEWTLDRPAGDHQKDDAVENLSTQCELVIRNTRFGCANTHLRLQTRGDILIEDCEIELPILLTGDMSYWFESSPCERLTVRNCAFLTEHAVIESTPEFFPTERAPYYHGDITVENCRFASETPIRLRYTRSASVKGCSRFGGGAMKMRLTNCGDAAAENWTIERETEEKQGLFVN